MKYIMEVENQDRILKFNLNSITVKELEKILNGLEGEYEVIDFYTEPTIN